MRAHAPNGTDSRNIKYQWYGGKSNFVDPSDIFREAKSNMVARDIPERDAFLCLGYMWGHTSPAWPVLCTSLTLDLAGNGDYEMSFKTGELYLNRARVFSIQLNGQYVVDEIDLIAYRAVTLGLELNVNFKISQNETIIEIQGHPT